MYSHAAFELENENLMTGGSDEPQFISDKSISSANSFSFIVKHSFMFFILESISKSIESSLIASLKKLRSFLFSTRKSKDFNKSIVQDGSGLIENLFIEEKKWSLDFKSSVLSPDGKY